MVTIGCNPEGLILLRLIIRALFRSSSSKAKPRTPPRSVPVPITRHRSTKPTVRPPVSSPRPTPSPPPASVKHSPEHETTLTGKCYVVDGDTIRIGKVSIRLAGIDAPELDHPWGKKAKWELVQLCKGEVITAEIEPEMSYDRVVATCFLPDGRDLSAEMVRVGLALDWTKFSGGRYAHLEPEGARKKHWKAAAKQRGHMQVFHK